MMTSHKKLEDFSFGMLAVSSFLGAAFISLDIKVAEITLYRAFLLINIISAYNLCTKNTVVKNSKHTTIYILWLLYAMLSILWVKDYYSWFRSVFLITTGVVGYIEIAAYIQNIDELEKLFKWLTGLGIVFCVVGVFEFTTGKYLFTRNQKWLDSLDRYHFRTPIFVSGNPNDYALAISFFFYIFFAKMLICEHKVQKIIFACFMGICIFLIVISTSRAVILGIFVGVFLLLIKFGKLIKRRIVKYGYNIIKVAIILGILYLFISMWQTDEIAIDTTRPGSSDQIRLNLAKNGMKFLGETLFIGVGSGNVEYWMKNYAKYDVGRITNMHNWWIEVLVSYGVIIFCLYMYSLYNLFKELGKIDKADKPKKITAIAVSLESFMITLIIGSITASSNLSVEWLWIYYGICIGFININKKYSG